MKEQKIGFKQRVKLFFKKNLYAIVVAGSALVLAVALAITAMAGRDFSKQQESDQHDLGVIPNIPMEDAQASSTAPIIFNYPVEEYTLGNTYNDSSLVYNETLNEYTTHLGMDFIVSGNVDVMACYGGTVESIDYDSLTGTKIVIDHGDGLKTVYQSLDSDVTVQVGQKVAAGEVIGKASDSAGGEQGLGAHIHFETIKDGQAVDPMTYFGEK